ncbi:MAG: hypothetical protein GXX79_13770 [Actinomycetales bacterium]|nr:hypothetical protein [Actinomycetales bacterium]
MRMYKGIASVGMAAGLVVTGALSAQAWTWASSSNPIVMSGGGGYGNIIYGGVDYKLQSWLRDTKVGDGRVYAHVRVTRKSDNSVFHYLSSGKRSDGESSYARMADKTGYLDNGTGTFRYRVDTCRSVTLNDPCSEDKRYSP